MRPQLSRKTELLIYVAALSTTEDRQFDYIQDQEQLPDPFWGLLR